MTEPADHAEAAAAFPTWPEVYAEAVLFAAERHGAQVRKGSGRPYLLHPLRVCERLRHETSPAVSDQVTLVAALLHDLCEDTATSAAEIESRFGPQVAAVVEELTNDTGVERTERKARMIERFRTASLRARLVKLADRLDNLSDPPAWGEEKWRAYLEESEKLLAALQAEPLPEAHPNDAGLTDPTVERASFVELARRLSERIAQCRANWSPPLANGPPV